MQGELRQWLVFAQDLTGYSYDEDAFIAETMELNRRYPGAGTGQPAQAYVSWYGKDYVP